jgi:hypothetical protein
LVGLILRLLRKQEITNLTHIRVDKTYNRMRLLLINKVGRPEARGDSGHREGDEVIEISVSGVGQLQGSETDVVQRLVVYTIALVRVLYQLVN